MKPVSLKTQQIFSSSSKVQCKCQSNVLSGCDLDQNTQTVEVTGHSGESVVLPCSCTELQDTPLQLTWTFTSLEHTTKPEEIYPNEQSKRHRGRVKLLNESSPGNLSLHISDLNTEDQGEYHCSVLHQPLINITLSVQGKILLCCCYGNQLSSLKNCLKK